jgi:hypothetical protein
LDCFTKFPVALSGGSNENRDPVAGENEVNGGWQQDELQLL